MGGNKGNKRLPKNSVNTTKAKKLSNPLSTGNSGGNFEARVQASFVVQMLAEGSAPCLTGTRITKVEFQNKFKGIETDDATVYAEGAGGRESRLLCQIKRGIRIQKNAPKLAETIKAAWDDFKKPKFRKDSDRLALITDHLSSTDIALREVLEAATASQSVAEFRKRMSLGQFTSENQRNKLKVVEHHLKRANGNALVNDQELFEFLRCFRVLTYDLDIKGASLSLLQTITGMFSSDAEGLWAKILMHVSYRNERASSISKEDLPADILSELQKQPRILIPDGLAPSIDEGNWHDLDGIENLVPAILVGQWQEGSDGDRSLFERVSDSSYDDWQKSIQPVVVNAGVPLRVQKGLWEFVNRRENWDFFRALLFDRTAEKFIDVAREALLESSPAFDLPPDERVLASIKGKVPKYSPQIKMGFAEGLALLSQKTEVFNKMDKTKAQGLVFVCVRKIYDKADWKLWASLDRLHPYLAEAAPVEFLDAVEELLNSKSGTLQRLFSLESSDLLGGGNYVTGLLWALETLAWSEEYLSRVTDLLGQLASRDPGGNWANRPFNSLISIFLPWYPQTLAPSSRRVAAVKMLSNECEEVAFKLILSLMPQQHQSTSGTHKPSYFLSVPEESEVDSRDSYAKEVREYSKLLLKLGLGRIERMKLIIRVLPQLSSAQLNEFIESVQELHTGGEDLLDLWHLLLEHCTIYKASSAKTSGFKKLKALTDSIAPKQVADRAKHLFGPEAYQEFYSDPKYTDPDEALNRKRDEAVAEIFATGGFKSALGFANSVDDAHLVGVSLAHATRECIQETISIVTTKKDSKAIDFARYYIKEVFRLEGGWTWFEALELSHLNAQSMASVLLSLPGTNELILYLKNLSKKTQEHYWSKVGRVAAFADWDMNAAAKELLKHNRPALALSCIHKRLYRSKKLDSQLALTALNAMTQGSGSEGDGYEVVQVLAELQKDKRVEVSQLIPLEFYFLDLLTHYPETRPLTLVSELATDPVAFHELIKTAFRSRSASKKRELSESESARALQCYKVLEAWDSPPGLQVGGKVNAALLNSWVNEALRLAEDSGHVEIAQQQIGAVFLYAPTKTNDGVLEDSYAKMLNASEHKDMRRGFEIATYNSRGAHNVDPKARPELKLQETYSARADAAELEGFHRLAETYRNISGFYEREAQRILERYEDT